MSRAGEAVRAQLRPTPWGDLSGLRRVRRVFGGLLFLSSLAMAAAAATASTDWDITQEKVEQQFG